MAKREIAVLTGTRAEYGLLRPVMEAIRKHQDLTLRLLVTGMHLDPDFGMSVNQIEADGFEVHARIPIHTGGDEGRDMALAVSEGIRGITDVLEAHRPEVLLLLGDRTEVLAAAIAAAYLNIPVAHIHGGDRSQGGLDESVRHAVTKFAHIHFPATQNSADRIRRLGENPEHIFVTGAPGLDTILHKEIPDRDELAQALRIPLEEDYLLLVQHPVSTSPDTAAGEIRESLAAVEISARQCIIIHPNSDAGGRSMIAEIEKAVALSPRIHSFVNLPHAQYLGLMKHCGILLGNSSSGMIESSSFRIPVINIGERQKGRECERNVIHTGPDREEILRAMAWTEGPEFREILRTVQNPYGDGHTGTKIAEILANFVLDNTLLHKQISY